MKVTHVKISNILGLDSLEISPGKLTEISGRNGEGKTSVVEAIKSALKGGHDATLLRNGAEEGEVVLVFDNGYEIRKHVTTDKSDLRVRNNGVAVKSAATVLDSLRDLISVNPVDFIHADSKRRLQLLLEALPIELTDAELSSAAGHDCKVSGNPLDCIGSVRKAVYDERTGLNRAIKEKTATVNQLVEAVPPPVIGDPGQELASIDEKIERLQKGYSDKVKELADEESSLLIQIAKKREVLSAGLSNEQDKYKQRRAELVEIVKNQAAQAKQREIIDAMEKDIKDLDAQARGKTEALSNLDSLRDSKLKGLPFKGLVIQDGEIYINGVIFDRVNTSDQVRFAMQLAAVRAGELKLVCVDGLEILDPERYVRFVETAGKMDLQFIVTRVADKELSIATDGTEVVL